MRQAIELARNGKGWTSPNPCVGAVVVRDGRVVGRGWHRAAGKAHAEVEAIDDAGSAAQGATLYVTLEPCNHFGKTPPCTHKIVEAGIRTVVVGCRDPNPFVSGGGIQHLTENGIIVIQGVMEQEAQTLIEDFIWYTRNHRHPFVILKTASTLDGRTATVTGDSQWITSPEARAHAHRIRHEVDAVLIGSGTLNADNPSLTSRVDGQKTRDPLRVVLDTHLTIREDARLLNQTSSAGTLIVTHAGSCGDKRDRLRKKEVEILDVSLKNGLLDLNELMISLGRMSLLSVLIEGGATVAGSALRAGIVNKVMMYMAPKILGGGDGRPLFEGPGPERIRDVLALKDMKVAGVGPDLLVTGYLK